MTTKDLYERIPLTSDFGVPIEDFEDKCGHCGQPNDFHKLSWFCRRCYFWMHKGDTTVLHGLANDFNDINSGKIDPRLYELPKVEKPIYYETKDVVDEKNKDKKRPVQG